MTRQILTPTSKKEIKDALTSKFDGRSYNYFQGEIRKGNKYARLYYYFTGNKITIQITYWQDGIDYAIETASNCSTPTGVANKVAKFLDLK
jgi:hypothetical protein